MLPAFWGTVVQSETIIHFCAPGVRAISPLCLLQGATTFRSDPLWLSGCLVSVDARAGLSFVSEEAFANAVSRALGKAQVSRWRARRERGRAELGRRVFMCWPLVPRGAKAEHGAALALGWASAVRQETPWAPLMQRAVQMGSSGAKAGSALALFSSLDIGFFR